MNTIRSIEELPKPSPASPDRDHRERWEFLFLRSASDFSVLIDCHQGECYRKPDGSDWPHEGYSVTREMGTNTVTHAIKTAFAGGRPAKGTATALRGAA